MNISDSKIMKEKQTHLSDLGTIDKGTIQILKVF